MKGYTFVEMAAVLVVISCLLLLVTPVVRPIDRLALIDFTDTLVSDIREVGQYPYISENEGCVPKLTWYMKDRTYIISCGRTSISTVTVPDGIKIYLPTSRDITFYKSNATYAGQWKFESETSSVLMKFRMGTYEPEVFIREGE